MAMNSQHTLPAVIAAAYQTLSAKSFGAYPNELLARLMMGGVTFGQLEAALQIMLNVGMVRREESGKLYANPPPNRPRVN